MKEWNVGEMLAHCPNFIDPGLRKMDIGNLGEQNVYLRQQTLPSVAGRLDLTFIKPDVIHLVEVKNGRLKLDAVDQVFRYAQALSSTYPQHPIRAYLVGRSCPNRKDLQYAAHNRGLSLTILTFPRDIPPPNRVKICKDCLAGVDARDDTCPLCKNRRFL